MKNNRIDAIYPPGVSYIRMKRILKKRILRRLKILEGQVRGLHKIVEKEEYCVDILHQTMAIKNAMSSVEDLIMENHLSTHVVEQMKGGKTAKAVDEILALYKLAKRK